MNPFLKWPLVAIFLYIGIANLQPSIWLNQRHDLPSLKDHFSKAKTSVQNSRAAQLPINSAKLKPATNSYVQAVFPDNSFGFDPNYKKENATILMLCRNWELVDVLKSMRSLEDRFNKDYHYTWTFLNDVEFTSEFIEETTAMASGRTQYGLIPEADWNTPGHINQTKYDECVEEMIKNDVIYGFSKSYRNMCRFNSGFFFRQELVMNYDYYFRVEPGVEYFCDFQMDPFRFLRENNKKYGFVITILEYENTIPSLWNTVENFLNEYPQHLHPNSLTEFITEKGAVPGLPTSAPDYNSSYNLCHFWSNFEIGDLNFFRSQEYMDYFNYLDQAGGFYYERWGDAPVHSIAVSLLLDKDQIHHFEDFGYTHTPFATCPMGKSTRVGKRCICDKDRLKIDLEPHSCLGRWWVNGPGKRFMREDFDIEKYSFLLEESAGENN